MMSEGVSHCIRGCVDKVKLGSYERMVTIYLSQQQKTILVNVGMDDCHLGICSGVKRHLCAGINQFKSSPEHGVPPGIPTTAFGAQGFHLCAKHAHCGYILFCGNVGTLLSR